VEMKIQRSRMREEYGVKEDEILCIYTGRFTEGKNPLCLAQSIHKLRHNGENYKGLFIGSGIQKEQICRSNGCIVKNFVKFIELANLYAIADIGIWPREESTSMLDAAASGLPLIISNTVQATERVKDIGLTYIENDIEDLCSILLRLKDPVLRKKLGENGVERMRNHFSWLKMAQIRVEEFIKVLNKN